MKCAILVYHRILGPGTPETPEPPGAFHDLPEALFLDHLDRLSRWGVPRPGELPIRSRSGQRAVLLSFDDGTEDHARVAELLESRGMRGLFLVSPGLLGRPGRLTPEQARRLADHGHALGAHGMTHRRLDRLPDEEARREIRQSLPRLGDIIGRPVTWFAPPGGFLFPGLLEEAERAGASAVRSMRWGDALMAESGAMRGELPGWPMHRGMGSRRWERILEGRAAAWPWRVKNGLRRLLGEPIYQALRDGAWRG